MATPSTLLLPAPVAPLLLTATVSSSAVVAFDTDQGRIEYRRWSGQTRIGTDLCPNDYDFRLVGTERWLPVKSIHVRRNLDTGKHPRTDVDTVRQIA